MTQEENERNDDILNDVENWQVLDPAQLSRIEAVHGGFFYQHLYAVAVLLTLGRRHGAVVATERDEDIEVTLDGTTHYIQVKTRRAVLQRNDVADVLIRFASLKTEHDQGQRAGDCSFTIVANCEPGPGLIRDFDTDDWPAYVDVATPERPPIQPLPDVPMTIGDALACCDAAARNLPFSHLSANTLVLKLAAKVQHAATGANKHLFRSENLPDLFEQIVVQLQQFPPPPAPYRPQRNEPPLDSETRVRLIVGFSGAGKTAWAAEKARNTAQPTLYFNVRGLPTNAIPTNLARELVAKFLGSNSIQLPAEGGVDLLRACALSLVENNVDALVVLDNSHQLSLDDIRMIIEAAPSLSFVLLCQPWEEQKAVEALCGGRVDFLQGFDDDAIAEIFRCHEANVDAVQAAEVRKITGGMPLFVIGAAQITASDFAADAGAFCAAIRERTHHQDTAQELILEGAFAVLSERTRRVAALLSISDVLLAHGEVTSIMQNVGTRAQVAQAMRELRRESILVAIPDDGVGLHDAFRPLAADQLAAMDHNVVETGCRALHDQLHQSWLNGRRSIPRLTLLIKLLPRIGRTDVLVDLATSEMFYEQGNMAMMRDTIEAAATDDNYSPRDRFWALDALSYWESRDGGVPNAQRIDQMKVLVQEHELEIREQLNLIFKQMLLAAAHNSRREIEQLMAPGRRLTRDRPFDSRILRYNRAVALFRIQAHQAARRAVEPVIAEYFGVIEVTELKLLGANGQKLISLLEHVEDRDDLKRLADALNLWATVIVALGHPPMLRRIQAIKLYALAGAGRSAAFAAQDAADDMINHFADPVGARQVIEEHVLPFVRHYHLTDVSLRARGQYAVVLAYCGDIDGARMEINRLRNYGGDVIQAQELATQSGLVEAIARGNVTLPERVKLVNGKHLVLNPDDVGKYPKQK